MRRLGIQVFAAGVIALGSLSALATNRPPTGPVPRFPPLKPHDTTPVANERGDVTQGGSSMQTVAYLDIPFKTITGNDSSLAAFRGKVVLLVNVASKCGYTPQYKDLETLFERYKSRGLIVVGFPANNFGAQEPGTNDEILNFCTTKYSVTFPMMAKVSVKGDDKHPLFKFLTEQSAIPGEIKWNFSKFLLDKDGNLVARYPSETNPLDPKLTSRIEALF